jgi:hypothetical protein
MAKTESNATPVIWMIVASMTGATLVLALYPMAESWRFPGGTPSEWYWCFIFNAGLLSFNIYVLKHLQGAKIASRLFIYISLAVTVYIFVILFQIEAARKIEQKLRGGVPIHSNS